MNAQTTYVTYNLRTYFSQEPGQPDTCPRCAAGLSRSSIAPSIEALNDLEACIIPDRGYTLLFICRECGWWCIRELWGDAEYGGYGDYLVVTVQPQRITRDEALADLQSQPWLAALADAQLYGHPLPLPEELARLFPVHKP
jgi:hypothetical protein